MNDRMFRTNLIGGFNKEDVRDYVESLERELARLKERGASTQNTADGGLLPNDEDTLVLTGNLGQITEENQHLSKNEEKEKKETTCLQPELEKKRQEIEAQLSKECRKTEMLEQRVKELEAEASDAKLKLERSQTDLKEMAIQTEQKEKDLRILQLEKEKLELQVKQLNEERKDYEEDYKAVKNVLLDARINAEIIMAKARERAESLLKKAEREALQKQRQSLNGLVKNLAENNSKLGVSKYYLEEQVKEIEKTQKQIQEIQDSMALYLAADNKKSEDETEEQQENDSN